MTTVAATSATNCYHSCYHEKTLRCNDFLDLVAVGSSKINF